MKLFFTKKNFMQKMIICIVMVLLVNFTLAPSYSQASLGDDLGNMFFNILLRCGDGIIWVVQKVIYGMDSSFITIDRGSNWRGTLAKVLLGVGIAAAIVGSVAATIASGGAAAPACIAVIAKVATGIGIAAFVGAGAAGVGQSKQELKAIDNGGIPPTLYLPLINISPDAIFNNQIGLTDVNFFNPSRIKETTKDGNKVYYIDTNGNGSYEENTDTITTQSTAAMLRDSITKWYYSIRNLSLVGLLSVLIYVGIRIILSSSTSEKAKYKSMITDWVVAICLVMVLHYIMVFAITLVEKITYALGSATSGLTYYSIADEKTLDEVRDTELANFIMTEGGQEVFVWPVNLIGAARMESQFLSVYDSEELTESDDSDNIDVNQSVMQKMGYTVIYLALVFFTIYFLFYYVRRVVYLAFLTLIAPLIALTYPIDKINDGSAQGFSVWLKEYMYNLLIQPFHLLLYTIFITTAFEFAENNPIYVCVILGFLMSAEKLLRKMFNFNKSETASAFSGAAAGSMMATALSKAASKAKALGSHSKGGKAAGTGGSGGKETGDDDRYQGRSNDTEPWLDKGEDEEKNPDSDLEEKQKELDDESAKIDKDEQMMKNNYEAARNNPYANPVGDDMIAKEEEKDKAKIAERRAALQQKLEGLEAEKAKRQKEREEAKKAAEKKAAEKAAEEAKKQEKAEKRKKISDKFTKGKIGTLTRPARALGRKLKYADARTVFEKGLMAPLRFSAGVVGGGVGLGLMATASMALDDSPKEILTKAALGGTGGFAIGAGGAGAVDSVGTWGGNVGNAFRNYASDYRYMKNEDLYGKDEANRLRDIENKEKADKMDKHLDKYHPELNKKERKEAAHEIAEYSADTGVNDYKMIDKARKLQSSTDLTKEQIKGLLASAEKYKKDKPTGGMLSDADRDELKKTMERRLNDALIKQEEKQHGSVSSDRKAEIKKEAHKKAEKYVNNLEKLL